VSAARDLRVTPHVAQNITASRVDYRRTHHTA
jgi:hypothetical protein